MSRGLPPASRSLSMPTQRVVLMAERAVPALGVETSDLIVLHASGHMLIVRNTQGNVPELMLALGRGDVVVLEGDPSPLDQRAA